MTMLRALLVALVVLAVSVATAQAAPVITATCDGSSDCTPWFTSPVALRWAVAAGTPTAGCVSETVAEEGPDVQRGCIADGGGITRSDTVHLKIDLTPPVVTGVLPERPPDHDGWYTHPVSFTAEGQDSNSGLASCDRLAYAGPDSAAASIVTICHDVAGNAGVRAFPFRYDATPPDPGTLPPETGDRLVQLSWPAATAATVTRIPGLRGAKSSSLRARPDGLTDLHVRNGVRYRYLVTVADEAGNTSAREFVAVPGPHLLEPARAAILTAPPLLRWSPVRGARYYNVQLFRHGRKILSAWPRRPRLQLHRAWRFGGKRRRLTDDTYRWYVWPGEGARADRRYGERIGARSFVIDRQQ